MSNSWTAMQQQLGENDRLRWGVWCIVGLILFYGILVLSDTYTEYQIKVQQLSSQLEELGELASPDIWQERLDDINRQSEELESGFWLANTAGLAQAALQGSLEQLARKAAMQRVSVKISSPVEVEDLEGVSRVRLELNGAFSEGGLFLLLESIEELQPAMYIERAQINWATGRNNISMQLTALIKLDESA